MEAGMSQHLLDTFEKLPFPIERGEGVYVFDDKDNRYLDLYGGHAVSLLGHCPRAIVEAVTAQANKLFFYSNIAETSIRSEAADALAQIVHSSYANFFFCNSGAEANENALKLAIRLTGRQRIASFKGSFHGRALLCTAVSDNPKTNEELGDWTGDRVTFLNPNDLEGLAKLTDEFACVILEPIQSMSGMVEFSYEYLTLLIDKCRALGILVIFDEVQTGFGRTGQYFVTGYSGLQPDMLTSAKGIASGYPIGLLAVSDDLKPRVNDLGSTYGGGPVAMAAVKATARALRDPRMLEHVRVLGQKFAELINVEGVEEVRGKGCLIGIKTVLPARQLRDRLLERRIITGTSKDPHVLRLLPPIILEESHIDEFRAFLMDCLK
jgi:acetylornithine/succinyldiaminopimelate/putrescine aminotransferase